MIRKAFVMNVNPDQHEEYERRHSPIWPELEETLKAQGVLDYSIYLDAETSTLFAYAVIEDEERWAEIANLDICKKWWAYMSDLMDSNPDNSPVVKEIREVFHIEK